MKEVGGEYTCLEWSENTDSEIDPSGVLPLVVADTSDEYVPWASYPLLNKFFEFELGMPNVVFLDHNLRVYYKQSFSDVLNNADIDILTKLEKKDIIDQMLENMGDK